MTSQYLLATTILLVLLGSCTREKGDQLGITPTEEVSGNIEVRIQPPGKFYGNPQPTPLTLLCRTEKQYPCANYNIAHTIKRNGNGFEIEFRHVEKYAICLTTFGPANVNIPLEGLAEGNYELKFVLGGKNNDYILEVRGGSYQIVQQGKKGNVSFAMDAVMTIPPNTLWGKMWDHSGDDITPLFEQFNNGMNSKGATLKKLSPGNYWIFSVDNTGEMVIEQGSTGKGYFYQYTGDINSLEPLIDQFADSITVRLQNNDGVLLTN